MVKRVHGWICFWYRLYIVEFMIGVIFMFIDSKVLSKIEILDAKIVEKFLSNNACGFEVNCGGSCSGWCDGDCVASCASDCDGGSM